MESTGRALYNTRREIAEGLKRPTEGLTAATEGLKVASEALGRAAEAAAHDEREPLRHILARIEARLRELVRRQNDRME